MHSPDYLLLSVRQGRSRPDRNQSPGQVISVDAKLNFDDNAQFGQKDIFAMDVHEDTDPKEIEIHKYNLNYIAMEGNIGCLVNGAVWPWPPYMDIIKLNDEIPVNFLDEGGNAKEKQVLKTLQILTSDPNVKAILVNIFGEIVNFTTIADGIVNATKTIGLKVPLVVRLKGTNVDAAKKILEESGLMIESVHELEEAAKKTVRVLS
ncbi:AAEL017086-PA [Aedes aegypti]|uniref:AAEL017086-PA n=1 Tax=Aedes aegypti TaxID=7159 RepID=J9EAU0_AEDAE|nr:AAEL017086-PA [Aedes aegypti]